MSNKETNTLSLLNERKELENTIDNLLAIHAENSKYIEQFISQSASSLFASKSRIEKLHNQSFFRKIISKFKGNNKGVQENLNLDFYNIQHQNQLLIQKLAEQNLMCFQLITELNKKLNSILNERAE